MLWILTGLTAAAGGLDLGVGLRNSLNEEGMLEGGRLLARWSAGAWAVEAGLYASPYTERILEFDEVIVAIINSGEGETYSRTVGVDRATIGGMLSHRFIPPADGLSCGPAVYLGGEFGQQALYTIHYVDEYSTGLSEEGTRLVAGPMGGVGLELTVERISSRFAVLDRVRIIDGDLRHDPTLTLDVMWRL